MLVKFVVRTGSRRARARHAAIQAELVRRHAPTARLRTRAEAMLYAEPKYEGPRPEPVRAPFAIEVGLVDPASPATSGLRWVLVK